MTPAPLTARTLASAGVRHAFFTRVGGVSEGVYASLNGGTGSRDRPEAVAHNRAAMARHLGVAPDRLVLPHLVHSATAVVVDAPWPGERPRADGLATRARGLALGVTGADCGTILFADVEAGVVGAAHAGWRGALGGVLEATLDAMETIGARRERVVTALGPTIAQASYEVGREFLARFVAEDAGSERFFAGAPGAPPRFDLPGYISARLARAGVAGHEDLARDTYADEALFYSFRRATHRGEPDYGRLVSAIVLG